MIGLLWLVTSQAEVFRTDLQGNCGCIPLDAHECDFREQAPLNDFGLVKFMESYSVFAFLLLIFGIGILLSEVVIPSAGLLSFLALSCFLGSGFCAYHAWYVPGDMLRWWGFIFGVVFVIPSTIAGVMYYLPRTKMGQELFAAPPNLDELTPFVGEEQRLIKMIDEVGVATTLFSPGGMAGIGQEKLHAEAEGVLIEPGTEIIVVGVKGNRLIVRPLSLHPTLPAIEPEAATEDNYDQLAPDARDTEPLSSKNDQPVAEQRVTPEMESPNLESPVPTLDESTDVAADETTADSEPHKTQEPDAIDFDIPETA